MIVLNLAIIVAWEEDSVQVHVSKLYILISRCKLTNWNLYVTLLKVKVTSLIGIFVASDDEDAMIICIKR